MKEPSISESMKDHGLDKKGNDNATHRAKERARERSEKLARRKKIKDIFFFTLYGALFIYFTAVVGWMIIKTLTT